MRTLKQNNSQYVKSLGNGEHLLWDYDLNYLEIWFNNKNHSSHGLIFGNTLLEFARSYPNQGYTFVKKLNELILERQLPNGAGIDCQWLITDMGKYFKCLNSFHCMNDNGYYCGYAEFTLIIPKKNPMNFNIHFNGDFSQRLNYKYNLREYLEDIFHNALLNITSDLNPERI